MPAIVSVFSDFETAAKHQKDHGGWIFVPEGDASPIWFDATRFTPFKIMAHNSTKGLSGKLV